MQTVALVSVAVLAWVVSFSVAVKQFEAVVQQRLDPPQTAPPTLYLIPLAEAARADRRINWRL